MKKFNLFLLLAFFGLSVSAQTIIVQKADGTNARMFKSLDEAVTKADANDYVYIGGGEYKIESRWRGYNNTANNLNWLVVEKPLHFVGGGYKAGSDIPSAIIGTLAFRKSASGSTVTGLLFKENVYLDSISNTIISRCQFNMLYLCGEGSNDMITECVGGIGGGPNLNSVNGTGVASYSCVISKNILSGVKYLNDAMVNNNVLFYSTEFYKCNHLTIENNFFRYGINFGNEGLQNSVVRNNIFPSIPTATYNNSVQNNIEEWVTETFVDNNYNLKPTSLGKNAGTDGTDIGIYGTSNPFKENTTTAYPQVIRSVIGSETNAEEKLNVDIKVEAQNK